MKKLVIAIIVIAVLVVGRIWFSGYNYAKKLVNDEAASLLTISYVVEGMNDIKKSGFMYYMENKTDYNSKLKTLGVFNWIDD